MPLKWSDADEIGCRLHEQHPQTDPLSVRFTELHKLVTALAGFADDAAGSSEAKLEAIQMAWLEYFNEGK